MLQYRALEDLSRGWRIVQPNLEQTGLLHIGYDGLEELAGEDHRWTGVPRFDAAAPETRVRVLTAFLDHLRMQLAIEAPVLKREGIDRLRQRTASVLRDPWAVEENDRLREQTIALLPSIRGRRNEGRTLSLGPRSQIFQIPEEPHAPGARTAINWIHRSRDQHWLRTSLKHCVDMF